jgi:putative spermidine/putrescine transport system permease protein
VTLTRQAPAKRRALDGSGARWLLLPPALLLVAGMLGPLLVTCWIALRENGPAGVVAAPLSDDLVVASLGKTLWLSVAVTAVTWLCAVIFTLAIGLSRPSVGNLLFGILFLTFWISLLVRTYAWVLVLQPNGALDGLAAWAGIMPDGAGLFQTMPGLIPPMVHVMLPYMVLPIYAAMRSIDPVQIRAARSLGASEPLILWRVVLPSLRSGSWAGILLVFILSLGFYVTPAFLGGPDTQVLAMVIGVQFGRLQNVGLTAATGVLLLLAVLALYLVADRMFGISRQWGRS